MIGRLNININKYNLKSINLFIKKIYKINKSKESKETKHLKRENVEEINIIGDGII